jgi:hypothetical protein
MSTTSILKILVIALPGAVMILVLLWMRRRRRWHRLIPGIAATVATVLAFLSSYFWLFETGDCSNRSDFGCILNENQGFLTFLGLAFAGLSLWAVALSRWADQRLARARDLEATRHALVAATDECLHNLIHVGSAVGDDGRWAGFMPELTVSAIPILLEPGYRKNLDAGVVYQADAILRNWHALEHLPPGWSSHNDDSSTPEPDRFSAFVSRSILLLLTSLRAHPKWCSERLNQRRLQILHEMAADKRTLRYKGFSSDIAKDAADLRVNDMPLVCWWDDKPIKDVKTYEMGPVFRDLAQGHKH